MKDKYWKQQEHKDNKVGPPLKKRRNIDTRYEPEDDDSQIEALMVDCGRKKLMFED